MMNTPLLEIKQLHYAFLGCSPQLRGINLKLDNGCFDLLVGKNGTGKTLLMNHLNGLTPIQKGEILFQGIPVSKVKNLREKVGLVFQNADSQFVAQSVFREIAFGPSNIGLTRENIQERTEKMLSLFQLENFRNRNPHSLSGGEKRRLAMASVMVMNPDLLVLDEPFTGLDLPGVVQTLQTLLDLRRAGCSLLLITHDVEKCLAHCNKVHILDSGTICKSGSPEEILGKLKEWEIYSPWQKDRPLSSYTWLQGAE